MTFAASSGIAYQIRTSNWSNARSVGVNADNFGGVRTNSANQIAAI